MTPDRTVRLKARTVRQFLYFGVLRVERGLRHAPAILGKRVPGGSRSQ